MTVFYLPIEPLEERYSAQMLVWVERALKELDAEYFTVLPMTDYDHIQHGQWLDTYGTTRYRNKQMSIVATLFEDKNIKDGDVFLIGDVWYPGIEAIKLMADLSHTKVKVVGWHYAGTADPADLLSRELGTWGRSWESWLVDSYLDAICVGSQFHKALLNRAFVDNHSEFDDNFIMPLGLAWRPNDVINAVKGKNILKERIVVFPHRLAPEKNPEAFYHLAEVYASKGWRFVISTNNENVARQVPKSPYIEVAHHSSKQAYYEFLASCSIYYSAATQETFGYALHEAIALGLSIVAPDRCSYSEMLQHDPNFLYKPTRESDGRYLLDRRMINTLVPPLEYTLKYDGCERDFIARVLAS